MQKITFSKVNQARRWGGREWFGLNGRIFVNSANPDLMDAEACCVTCLSYKCS